MVENEGCGLKHWVPNVHKEGVLLICFVFFPGTLVYRLAKELLRRLKLLICGSSHSVANAHPFLGRLKEVAPEEDEAMVPFNITTLFASTGLDLANKISEILLQHH